MSICYWCKREFLGGGVYTNRTYCSRKCEFESNQANIYNERKNAKQEERRIIEQHKKDNAPWGFWNYVAVIIFLGGLLLMFIEEFS